MNKPNILAAGPLFRLGPFFRLRAMALALRVGLALRAACRSWYTGFAGLLEWQWPVPPRWFCCALLSAALFGVSQLSAQDVVSINLKQAVVMALRNSRE